ncbi:hypothetical protein [Cyclobacterium qasimii]|uniref:DUF4890 domain-containing protein n=1 Tax=Cyclobacterium qasimii TaxID=1350429 RepID=A0A512C784_9BACT|nr:hypothetical protein [Cyclobacterium qasimii]GEO20074.1 hypothetical protein CQA01_06080 [Cyclobacterium qasimii]
MKKILIMIAMVAVTSLTYAQGQRGQRPEPPTTAEIIKTATKELGLSEEQATEWTTIHEKYADEMKDRSTAKDAREKMDAELQATLTENQLETYIESKKKRESSRPARKPRN